MRVSGEITALMLQCWPLTRRELMGWPVAAKPVTLVRGDVRNICVDFPFLLEVTGSSGSTEAPAVAVMQYSCLQADLYVKDADGMGGRGGFCFSLSACLPPSLPPSLPLTLSLSLSVLLLRSLGFVLHDQDDLLCLTESLFCL